MEQAITGWSCDEHGDWVAHLVCGHRQHVRHNPPFLERPWVLTAASRQSQIGRPLACPLCDEETLEPGEEVGGDSPCLAPSVCAECGAMVDAGGGAHRPGCGGATGH